MLCNLFVFCMFVFGCVCLLLLCLCVVRVFHCVRLYNLLCVVFCVFVCVCVSCGYVCCVCGV